MVFMQQMWLIIGILFGGLGLQSQSLSRREEYSARRAEFAPKESRSAHERALLKQSYFTDLRRIVGLPSLCATVPTRPRSGSQNARGV